MTIKTPAEQAESDLSAFYSTDLPGVQAATYGGEDVTLRNLVFEDDGEGDAVVRRAKCRVRKTEVASPAYRGAVVIGSDTWYVRRYRGSVNGLEWALDLEMEERPAFRR